MINHITIYFHRKSRYGNGSNVVRTWDDVCAVPRVGDTVDLKQSPYDDQDGPLPHLVERVHWGQPEDGGKLVVDITVTWAGDIVDPLGIPR